MEKLTERQKDILQIIKKLTAENGYAPTVREIGKEADSNSPATIHTHLTKLEKKGYIEKGRKNRTLKLLVPNEYLNKSNNFVEVPFIKMGLVKDVIKELDIPSEYFKISLNMTDDKTDIFVLKVIDQDMKSVGINDNDLLVIEKVDKIVDNSIVVALAPDGKMLIKRFYRKDGFIHLESDTAKPIIVKNIIILGKVLSLYRHF